MLPNNVELLKACVEHPEPIYDIAYQKDYLVITRERTLLNDLMRANRKILENITAYAVNLRNRENSACKKIVEELVTLLETPEINNSEFTSFWECNDVSYRIYRSLTAAEKRLFLERIIVEYLNRRHEMYTSHGYSFTTLQVKADSFAHRRTGDQGAEKTRLILAKHGISPHDCTTDEIFGRASLRFIFPDKGDKKTFANMVREAGLGFTWSSDHKGKMPDYAIKIGAHLFIVEHKHMKELGGGQDKQIVEISEFIAQEEDDSTVHYVSFLDGILFNRILAPASSGKVRKQADEIYSSLVRHPNNYFVNTFGFDELIKSAVVTAS